MTNKEKLLEIISESEMSKSEIRKLIYPYLYRIYDSMMVKAKAEEIIEEKLDNIPEDVIIEVMRILGHDVKTDYAIEEKEEIKKEEENTSSNSTVQNLYNTTLIENESLREENKDKIIKELTAKIEKFENLIQLLKKYNVTEIGEFVKVADDDINELYISYLSSGQTNLNDAIIFEKENIIFVPKAYYKIDKNKGDV